MKRLLGYFFRGLSAVLPAAVTIAVLWWLGSTAEGVLGWLLKLVLPGAWYLPGMGLVAGVLLVIAVGVLAHAWLLRQLGAAAELLVLRTPVVKTIYGMFKDLVSFLQPSDGQSRMRSVVTVRYGESCLIGFVTRESLEGVVPGGADKIAVYLPMSYQLGGFTVLAERASVEPLDLDIESAMRFALTAGVQASANSRAT